MPTPKPKETQQEFISRCISYVIKEEGLDKDQAAGKCYGIWRQHKKKKKSGEMIRRPLAAIESDEETGLYKGYAILWGDPERRDMYNTYFRKDGEYCLDWYKELPWLYHHGMNEYIGTAKIGTWREPQVDDKGIFYLGELEKANWYAQQIEWLIEDGVLKTSSGTLDYLMQVDDYGGIKRWPIVELSSTVTPAEIRIDAIKPVTLQALRALDGRFDVSLLDKMKERLGTKTAEEDPQTEVKEEVVEVKEEEPQVDVVDVLRAFGEQIEAVVEVAKALDEVVKGQDARLARIEEAMQQFQKPPADQLKSLVSGDWVSQLYVASRQAPEVSKEDVDTETPMSVGIPSEDYDPVASAFFGRVVKNE